MDLSREFDVLNHFFPVLPTVEAVQAGLALTVSAAHPVVPSDGNAGNTKPSRARPD